MIDRADNVRPVILALDLARVTGFAWGSRVSPNLGTPLPPISGVWTLRSTDQPMEWEPGALIREILDLIERQGGRKPNLIVRERPMSAAAKWQGGNAQSWSIQSQMQLHGAVLAFASVSGIRCINVAPSTARKVVCGKAKGEVPPNASGKKPTTDQQSKATKIMVRDTMIDLGLVPPGTTALDQTDAVCVWAWADREASQLFS